MFSWFNFYRPRKVSPLISIEIFAYPSVNTWMLLWYCSFIYLKAGFLLYVSWGGGKGGGELLSIENGLFRRS